jgi:hypothetical protein
MCAARCSSDSMIRGSWSSRISTASSYRWVVDELREYPEWLIAHADYGDPECPGLLLQEERGNETDIRCNECGFILKTVTTADTRYTMDELELAGDVASEKWPHCGSGNLFPGFSRMLAFTCRNCGKGVGLAPSLTSAPGYPDRRSPAADRLVSQRVVMGEERRRLLAEAVHPPDRRYASRMRAHESGEFKFEAIAEPKSVSLY